MSSLRSGLCAGRIGVALLFGAVLSAAGPAESGDRVLRVRTAEGIQRVPLERYVASAVASETFASWPREALRAQAVVSRTYALHQRERRLRAGEPYDLESSVLSQRYGHTPVSASILSAVRDTRGEVLVYMGRPLLAVFHASAGGRTASAEEVWGDPLPYLRPVDGMDSAAPDFFWSYEIRLSDLADALRSAGYAPGEISNLEVLERSASGRVRRLRAGAARLSGRELRGVLGGRAIRSTLFEARQSEDRALFLGSGAGHGVGLSQWGARTLAQQGWGYPRILDHYYPWGRLVSLSRLGLQGERKNAVVSIGADLQ